MPSTGYGLALFHSVQNFAQLFKGGPVQRDADQMLDTFRDNHFTGYLIVAIPEETPLRESLELEHYLHNLFPHNQAAFLVNACFPYQTKNSGTEYQSPCSWPSPLVNSATEYIQKKSLLENHNLRIWNDAQIPFGRLNLVPPQANPEILIHQLTRQLMDGAYL